MKKIIAVLLWLGVNSALYADEEVEIRTPPSCCAIFGFVSQSFIKSDKNNFFGPSASGSTDFREYGIGATGSLADNVRMGGLVLGRRAGEVDSGKLRLDYLLIDWKKPELGTSNTSGITIGRIKPQIGLFNDVRDMASTRPSIILPEFPYLEKARNYLAHGDGIRVYRQTWKEDSATYLGVELLNMFDARTSAAEVLYFGRETPGELKGRPFLGVNLRQEFNGGKTKLGMYLAGLSLKYEAGSGDLFTDGNIRTYGSWWSAEQKAGPVTIIGELFLARFIYDGFGPALRFPVLRPGGGYIQTTYAFGPKWEGFLREERGYTNMDDRNGSVYAARTHTPGFQAYQWDSVLGGRYYVTPTFQLSAEAHWLRGTHMISTLDNNTADLKKDWKMVLFQAAYQF